MIGTISPMVDGERATGRRAAAHWLHLGGAVIGGTLAGVMIGLIGTALLSPQLALAATFVLAGLYGLHELGMLQMPTPERQHQVPIAWRARLPARITATAYGLMLGAGFLTHITTTTYYVMWFTAVATGVPLWAAAVGATYGAARGVPPFMLAALSTRGSGSFGRYDRIIRGDGRVVHIANGLVLVGMAGLLGVRFID